MAINSFKSKEAQKIFSGRFSKKLPQQIQQRGRESLKQLDAAENLNDLLIPPSNMLEQLENDRTGQYSIRINQQYRVCFFWKDGNAHEVEIVDYH
jgi:proteic killer suppression protein